MHPRIDRRSLTLVFALGSAIGLTNCNLVAQDHSCEPGGSRLCLGTPISAADVAPWDIDVRPDGHGLPRDVFGTLDRGADLFQQKCARCHGVNGDGPAEFTREPVLELDDRQFAFQIACTPYNWERPGTPSPYVSYPPILQGCPPALRGEWPEQTVGSYWPFATSLFDYIRRAMPYWESQSLSPEEIYSLVAFILHLNEIPLKFVDGNQFGAEQLLLVEMPARDQFCFAFPDTHVRPDVPDGHACRE